MKHYIGRGIEGIPAIGKMNFIYNMGGKKQLSLLYTGFFQ